MMPNNEENAGWLKKLINHEAVIALAIISIIGFLTYGTMIPWLGFYQDDMYFSWIGHARGYDGLYNAIYGDKPGSAIQYGLTYSLLGDHILYWHIYVFFLRLLGAFATLWMLRGIWPRRYFMTTTITILFLVYPGFSQQPAPIMYQNYLASILLITISLGATLRAEQASNKNLYLSFLILALISGLVSWSIVELTLGFELIRLFFIYYLKERQDQGARLSYKKLVSIGKTWLPYLVTGAGFALWRSLAFQAGRENTDVNTVAGTFQSSPLHTAGAAAIRLFSGVCNSILAWIFHPEIFKGTSLRFTLFWLVISLAGSSIFLFYYWWLNTHKEYQPAQNEKSRTTKNLFLFSILFLVAGLIVPAVTGFETAIFSPHDRFLLAAAFGSSMLMFGIVRLLCRSRVVYSAIGFALLIGLAMSIHVKNENSYRIGWRWQKDIWWQISWRIPQLEPGTIMVWDFKGRFNPITDGAKDFVIWGPLNRIYNNKGFDVMFGGTPLDKSVVSSIKRNGIYKSPRLRNFRGIDYRMNYADSLIIFIPPDSGCIQVINPANPEIPAEATDFLRSVAGYSRPDLIKTEGQHVMSREFFGGEPEHTWCFYYQKADLARQMDDWERVAQLGDEVHEQGFEPRDRTEWLPFIEGYANAGRCGDAVSLADSVRESLSSIGSSTGELDTLLSSCQK